MLHNEEMQAVILRMGLIALVLMNASSRINLVCQLLVSFKLKAIRYLA